MSCASSLASLAAVQARHINSSWTWQRCAPRGGAESHDTRHLAGAAALGDDVVARGGSVGPHGGGVAAAAGGDIGSEGAGEGEGDMVWSIRIQPLLLFASILNIRCTRKNG